MRLVEFGARRPGSEYQDGCSATTDSMGVQSLPFFEANRRFPVNIPKAIMGSAKNACCRGGDMKRLLWVTPMLFVLMSGGAFADTIIFLTPNDGTGDNFAFLQRGGGVVIGIDGGTPVDFYNFAGYAPGSTFGGETDVFFSGGFAQVGGKSYDIDFGGPGTLFLSSITFPTNGKDFTVRVGLHFSALVIIPDTGQTFDGSGGALGKMSFQFNAFDGLYYPDSSGFTTITPEPGTLGLMGTGLIGILALARRKLSI